MPTPPSKVSPEELVSALKENWLNEIVISRIYARLSELEKDEKRKGLLLRMAENEQQHAGLWEKRLKELGATVDYGRVDQEVAKQTRYASMFGTNAAIRRIEREERGHVLHYSEQVQRLGDPKSNEILAGIIPEEQEHADRLKRWATESKHSPKISLDKMWAGEKWHRGHTGGWLGDSIYGVNDGLGAVFGIVSTVAGATAHSGGQDRAVLLAGVAGMLASALSMGSGAYLATKSEREVQEAELSRERREIESDPQHEIEELELIYQLKGFSEDEAKILTSRIASDPDQFLRTMAAEELGIAVSSPPNAFLAALAASLSTAFGAFIPLIPFFFIGGLPALIWSATISLVAHFAVGSAKTLVTGRSWLASGAEMTIVGVLEAAVTYGIGLAFGSRL